jgi:hypothetical protein
MFDTEQTAGAPAGHPLRITGEDMSTMLMRTMAAAMLLAGCSPRPAAEATAVNDKEYAVTPDAVR